MKATSLASAVTSAALLSVGLSAPVARTDRQDVTARGMTRSQVMESAADTLPITEAIDPKRMAAEAQSVVAENFEGRFTDQDMATLGAVVEKAAVDLAELDQVRAFFEQNFKPAELEVFQARMKERKVLERSRLCSWL